MLLAQSFLQLLRQWDAGRLPNLPRIYVTERIPQLLIQILMRTLQSQGHDGSWGNQACEITAYSLLTLRSISSTPWGALLHPEISNALERGSIFLRRNYEYWKKGTYT